MCKVKVSCCIHGKERLLCVTREEMISFSVSVSFHKSLITSSGETSQVSSHFNKRDLNNCLTKSNKDYD